MRKQLAALSFLFLLVFGLAAPAGAGGGGGGPCSAVSTGATLAMLDFCFDGAAHIVEPGQTVTVVNNGAADHDVTAVDNSFASDFVRPGGTFAITLPEDTHMVRFFCSLHGNEEGAGMAGVLVAAPGDSAAATVGRGQRTTGMAGGTVAGVAEAAPDTATLDAALAAATQSAKTDATVALVVVTIIGMAVAFGLGLMVWAAGRLPGTRGGE
jgi:plastocyanin